MLNRGTYMLILLIEECAEVIQRACKAIRFGWLEVQQSNPDETRTNRDRLEGELDDAVTVLRMMQEMGYLGNFTARSEKREKILKYLRYSESLGLSEPGTADKVANSTYDKSHVFMYDPCSADGCVQDEATTSRG